MIDHLVTRVQGDVFKVFFFLLKNMQIFKVIAEDRTTIANVAASAQWHRR